MSAIDIQQVLSLRYRTSGEADRLSDELRKNLALDTRAQVARLAIGRSLALGPLNSDAPDAKGQEIAATILFNSDNVGAWVGLVVAHSLIGETPSPVDSMEDLRLAFRHHWHRGVKALWDDWCSADEDYEKFVQALVRRRADMPAIVGTNLEDEEIGEEQPPSVSSENLEEMLVSTLTELGIKSEIKGTIKGPRVNRYRVYLPNLSDINKLGKSVNQLGVALNLGSALPMVSNGDESKTMFIDVPRARAFWNKVGFGRLEQWAHSTPLDESELLVYPGVDITGKDISFDLTAAPHVLVGGTTGSGKSVCIHSMILSLLIRNKSSNVQFALIDPKQVEFSHYRKLSNLYGGKVVTEMSGAFQLLQQLTDEMERRYTEFQRIEVRDIFGARKKGKHLPFILVFVEELADLILQSEETEELLVRLAQKARAAGIHLVLATQRPDSATFSGLLRSNIPARIALTVQKGTESNIILDEKGAEALLGAGDMLIKVPGEAVKRAHGVFVKVDDIAAACAFSKKTKG